MASEIKRRRKPASGRHIQLGTTFLPKLGNGGNGPFKGVGVKSNAVTDASEIRQIKSSGPEFGHGLGRRPCSEDEEAADGVPLPQENGGESGDPENGEEGLVRGE